MAAGLEQTDAAHEHAADGELAMQQFDQRHASSDDIAPGFLADRCDAELLGGELQNFIFDETHRLVRTIDGIPGVVKKPITFQTAVGKSAYLGKGHHLRRRLRRDENFADASLPHRVIGFEAAPQLDRHFFRHGPNSLGHIASLKRHRPLNGQWPVYKLCLIRFRHYPAESAKNLVSSIGSTVLFSAE